MGEPTEIYVCAQSHFPDAGQGHGRWHGCQWCSPMMGTVIKFKHCYTPPKLISFGSSKQRAQDGDVEDPFIVKGCCDNDTWPGVQCWRLAELFLRPRLHIHGYVCALLLHANRIRLWKRFFLKKKLRPEWRFWKTLVARLHVNWEKRFRQPMSQYPPELSPAPKVQPMFTFSFGIMG